MGEINFNAVLHYIVMHMYTIYFVQATIINTYLSAK